MNLHQNISSACASESKECAFAPAPFIQNFSRPPTELNPKPESFRFTFGKRIIKPVNLHALISTILPKL
jgi:hypothetical protein